MSLTSGIALGRIGQADAHAMVEPGGQIAICSNLRL